MISVDEHILELCRKAKLEFLKHNPAYQGCVISDKKITYEAFRHYLEMPKDPEKYIRCKTR